MLVRLERILIDFGQELVPHVRKVRSKVAHNLTVNGGGNLGILQPWRESDHDFWS